MENSVRLTIPQETPPSLLSNSQEVQVQVPRALVTHTQDRTWVLKLNPDARLGSFRRIIQSAEGKALCSETFRKEGERRDT